MVHLFSSLTLVFVLSSVTVANVPTPTPVPVPASDQGVPPVPVPTVAPVVQPEPPVLDPGPVKIAVRACVDTNTDGRCSLGEGVDRLPVAIVDADTSAVLATKETDQDGRTTAALTLDRRASLSVDVPYLARAEPFWPGQNGVAVIIPAPTYPEVLP